MFSKVRDSSLAHIGKDSPSTYNIFTSPQTTYDAAPNVSGTNSDSNASQSRLFQFKSTSSVTSSNSPSSHYNGPSSSCGTSPEPSGQAATSAKDGSLEPITEKDGTVKNEHEFCKELGKACGCIANPIPAVMNHTTTEPENASVIDTTMTSAAPVDDSFEYFSPNQAKDPFAPMSWIDYPESNTALLGDGSFTGGFLSDISPYEMQAPMDWNDLTGSIRTGLTPAFQKPNPLESQEQMLATVNEEVVPGDNPLNFVPCHKIWCVNPLCLSPNIKLTSHSGTQFNNALTLKMVL
jgi:AP-1-like transcription factor